MVSATPQRRRPAARSRLPEPLYFTYEFERFEYKRIDGISDVLPPAVRVQRPQSRQISANCHWVVTSQGRMITGLRHISDLQFYGDVTAAGKKSLLLAQFDRSPDWTPNKVLFVVFPGLYSNKKTRISELAKFGFGHV